MGKFLNIYNQVNLDMTDNNRASGRIISEVNEIYFSYDFSTSTAFVEVAEKSLPNLESFLKKAVEDWAEAEREIIADAYENREDRGCLCEYKRMSNNKSCVL